MQQSICRKQEKWKLRKLMTTSFFFGHRSSSHLVEPFSAPEKDREKHNYGRKH